MNTTRALACGLLAAALAAAAIPVAATAATAAVSCTPQILDLGTLGGPGSGIYGSNQVGDWVGGADSSDGTEHAVIWHGSQIHDLGIPNSEADDINNAGVVVGDSDSLGAFFWRGGQATSLPIPNGWLGASVRRINQHNDAAGQAWLADGHSHAVVWHNLSRVQVLPTPTGFDDAFAMGINDAGAVVGFTINWSDFQFLAWEWPAGSGAGFPLADTNPAGFSEANVINNRGWVGETTDYGGQFGAWASVYRDGAPAKLGQFGADANFSQTFGQDQIGDYTGDATYNPEDNDMHVFITHVGLGRLYTLRPLSGNLLDGSNAHAVIAGYQGQGVAVGGDSFTTTGESHATVWTCAYQQAIDAVAAGLSRPDGSAVTPAPSAKHLQGLIDKYGSDPRPYTTKRS
jgi:hypothetical protein